MQEISRFYIELPNSLFRRKADLLEMNELFRLSRIELCLLTLSGPLLFFLDQPDSDRCTLFA